jgi:hypothetical protein
MLRIKNMGNNNCEKCHGTGWYPYSTGGTPHSKICEVCCKHDKGFFELKESYGEDNGKMCCMAGCGFTKERESEEKVGLQITTAFLDKKTPWWGAGETNENIQEREGSIVEGVGEMPSGATISGAETNSR